MDIRAAETAITAYWAEISKLAGDPKVRLEDLTHVARDTAADQWRQIIAQYRVKGWRQIGTPTIRSSAASESGERRYRVKACIDVGKVGLVNGEGKSMVEPNRPPRVEYAYVVEKDGDSFFVTQDKALGLC